MTPSPPPAGPMPEASGPVAGPRPAPRGAGQPLASGAEPPSGGPSAQDAAGAEGAAPPAQGTAAAPSGPPRPAPAASTQGHRPARPRRRGLRIAALLAPPLALLLGFALHLRAALAPPLPEPGETDGILVLTGGSERVATGLRLLLEGQARRLLISGAHPEAGLVEVAAAAGFDPAPLLGRAAVGHAAATTRGNAAEAAAWARAENLGSLRVVTAGYHMPRAMLELRRAVPGLRLVAHPVPSAALRAPGALWRPRIWALLAGEYARTLGAAAGLSGAFVPRRETP